MANSYSHRANYRKVLVRSMCITSKHKSFTTASQPDRHIQAIKSVRYDLVLKKWATVRVHRRRRRRQRLLIRCIKRLCNGRRIIGMFRVFEKILIGAEINRDGIIVGIPPASENRPKVGITRRHRQRLRTSITKYKAQIRGNARNAKGLVLFVDMIGEFCVRSWNNFCMVLQEVERRREAAKEWRDQQISELLSMGQNRNQSQEEQLRALRLEKEFERRALEEEEDDEEDQVSISVADLRACKARIL